MTNYIFYVIIYFLYSEASASESEVSSLFDRYATPEGYECFKVMEYLKKDKKNVSGEEYY